MWPIRAQYLAALTNETPEIEISEAVVLVLLIHHIFLAPGKKLFNP